MTLSKRSPWDSEEVAATAATAALLTGSVPRQERATAGQLDGVFAGGSGLGS